MTRPALRVISGAPTPEELAVVTAVVAGVVAGVVAAASGVTEVARPQRTRRGAWSDPSRQFRRPLLPGPNGWRAATLP